jgi:hypothetical protein
MDIVLRLQSTWNREFALQPKNTAQRMVVVEIQALKKEAADEISRLRELLTKMIEADSAIYSANDDYVGDVIGKLTDVHFKAYSKAKKYMANV